MAPTFDGENLICTLESGVTELDAQVWYSEWKKWVLIGDNLKYEPLFRLVVSQILSSSVNSGAYFFLQNTSGWRVRGPEEDITISITGNVALEDTAVPAVIPTTGAFTTLILGLQPVTQNVDSIIDATDAHVVDLRYLIESQRTGHGASGISIYWAPTVGDDTADGLSPETAVESFTAAKALATPGAFDVIFGINQTGSPITITDPIVVDVDHLNVRLPGEHDFVFEPSTDSADAVTITAEGVAMEHFGVRTTASGTPRNCITITGGVDDVEIRDVKIYESTNFGIYIEGGTFHELDGVFVSDCVSDGVNVLNSMDTRIRRVQVENCTGWAFQVLSDSPSVRSRFVRFSECMTHHNTLGGLNIGSNSNMTIIDYTNYFAQDSGNDLVVDGGTGTHNDLLERANLYGGGLTLPQYIALK